MRVLAQLSGVLIAALAIAGCGGSKHASSTSGVVTTSSTPATSSTPTTPSTPSASPTTAPHTPKPKAKTKTSISGGVSAQPSPGPSGGSSPGTAASDPAGGSGNARVPATFTIRAGGVSPATVSAPAFLAVQVTVVSGDGQQHTVVVELPGRHRTLSVPAHGRASVLLPGLKAGDYPVEIDARPSATLIIGGEPGP